MSSINLSGKFGRCGISKDPVVFVNNEDQPKLKEWWDENSIFTQLFHHPHPDTGASCPVIYVGETVISQIDEESRVVITIAVRPEKRGNGIKTISVLPAVSKLQ